MELHFGNFEKVFNRLTKKVEELESKLNEHITTPPEKDPQEKLTRNDIVNEYKVSLSTIHNAMRVGELKYSKVGRKTIFKRFNVENWINGNGGSNA